ncbi:sporulation integral membrane protein YtvI [Peribacillus cavernae]|uniref:Sporulation integral membrane protein YtvI n=2 Tax=Peribacillus cavernae TaxID=1674310 RepID=A0A433H7H1_9BACI|nr:sporulation integral membrane protein YtvI [Peribacillus cavernae]RUQ24269.1 sporulation integral membrane protein YtvI [Peribacillus cavernae]
MKQVMLLRWFWRIIILLIVLFLVPYSWTLIFALVTAMLLDRFITFIGDTCKLNRFWSVLIAFLVYVGGLLGLTFIVGSVLTQQIINLSQKFPGLVKDLYYSAVLPSIRQWEKYSQSLPADVIQSVEDAFERGITSLELFTRNLVEGTVQLVTLVPGFLIEFLIYLVALFLFSLEYPLLKRKARKFLKESTYQKLSLVFSDLNKAGIGFLKAQLLLSLITFSMAYIGLWLLEVPYTLLLSILIVVVDILPILGTGSVLVPWAVVAIIQGNQHLGIGLIIMFIVITVVRRIVEPKVYSANLGLTPLAALVSLYLGFKILGFIGLFIGPALVIVYETLKKAGVIKTKFRS